MGSKSCIKLWSKRWALLTSRRSFSYTPLQHSGHNRWSKIKHDKAKEDAVKSKERTLLSHEVFLASKYGGPDPNFNSRLAFAIASAKRGQLSKTSIDAAIAKGQGKAPNGAILENVTIEAMLPFGVAAILEYQTDSKARTLQDARATLKDCGGMATPTAFLFDRKGKVWFEPRDGVGLEQAMDVAIEAGAEDIAMEDGRLVIETSPTEVTAVAQMLQEQLRLDIHRTEILFDAKQETMVGLSDEQGAELQKVVDALEEESTLQALYTNATAL